MQRHFVNYNEIPTVLGALVDRKAVPPPPQDIKIIRKGDECVYMMPNGKMFTAFKQKDQPNETNKLLEKVAVKVYQKAFDSSIKGQDELFAEELCLVLENEKLWYDWWHRTGYLREPLAPAQLKRFLELRVPEMKQEAHRVNENVIDFLWSYFKERYAETVKSYNGTL